MLRYFAPISIFVVLLWFFARGLDLDPHRIPSPLIGKPVPRFSVPELHQPDRNMTEASFQGQFALLNVWGTWCSECFVEHAFLNELAQSGAITIYGLNWKDDRDEALSWLTQLGNPYQEVGFDDTGKVAIEWGVYGAPETFLIGPDGMILHKHLSPLTQEIWQRDFLPLMQSGR